MKNCENDGTCLFKQQLLLEEHIQQIIYMHRLIVVYERILLNATQNLKLYNEFATSYGNFMEFFPLKQRTQIYTCSTLCRICQI